MTTRRTAQEGSKGKGAAEDVEAQAAAVIEDSARYDADTRVAIKRALDLVARAKGGETWRTSVAARLSSLRGLLMKAAKGLPVFDANAIGLAPVVAARGVRDLMDSPDSGAPDFIASALRSALEEAQRRTGARLWIYTNDEDDDAMLASGGWSVERMARMFRDNSALDFPLEPRRDLAGLISAVLKHPDTPGTVYDALRCALAGLTESDAVNEDPAVIAVALAVHKAEEKGGEDAEA